MNKMKKMKRIKCSKVLIFIFLFPNSESRVKFSDIVEIKK